MFDWRRVAIDRQHVLGDHQALGVHADRRRARSGWCRLERLGQALPAAPDARAERGERLVQHSVQQLQFAVRGLARK